MKTYSRPVIWLTAGVLIGVLGARLMWGKIEPAQAANDRYEDYVICSGAVSIMPVGPKSVPTDGVWLLDYRSGKLLGTVIDRNVGKIVGWAEIDLVTEFGLAPKQNVHFIMTTGNIAAGQAALYIAETSTGKFGVYTMGPRPDAEPGVVIRRHDLVMFRKTS
jgi:hypothetical protein